MVCEVREGFITAVTDEVIGPRSVLRDMRRNLRDLRRRRSLRGACELLVAPVDVAPEFG